MRSGRPISNASADRQDARFRPYQRLASQQVDHRGARHRRAGRHHSDRPSGAARTHCGMIAASFWRPRTMRHDDIDPITLEVAAQPPRRDRAGNAGRAGAQRLFKHHQGRARLLCRAVRCRTATCCASHRAAGAARGVADGGARMVALFASEQLSGGRRIFDAE